MGKHFYDPLIAHFSHAKDNSKISAHGLFSLSDQMKLPEKQKDAVPEKEKKCCFLDDFKKMMHLH